MIDRTDWVGGFLLVLGLLAVIALPQIVWYLVTGDPMMPDTGGTP